MRDRLEQFGIKGCEVILVHGSPRSGKTAIIKNLAAMLGFEFTASIPGFSISSTINSKWLLHRQAETPEQLKYSLADFKTIPPKNKGLLVFETLSKNFYEAKENFLPMVDYVVDVPPISKESAAKFVSNRLTQKGFYCDEENVNNGLSSSSVAYWDVDDLIRISDLTAKSILIYGSVDDQSITSEMICVATKEIQFKNVPTEIQKCFEE